MSYSTSRGKGGGKTGRRRRRRRRSSSADMPRLLLSPN